MMEPLAIFCSLVDETPSRSYAMWMVTSQSSALPNIVGLVDSTTSVHAGSLSGQFC
jgi:hypothetical protein